MKDYICIAALMIAMAGVTFALTGCDVKQSTTASGGSVHHATYPPSTTAAE